MAKILICWELGANLGHLTRQSQVARRLRDAGHEVLFAARDLSIASAVLGPQGFQFVQAPFHSGRVQMPRPPVNYSELLLAEGFGSPAVLLGRVRAWQSLFDLFGANAIVVDHAPTALLAAHARQLPRVQVGCGFVIPPATHPFPRIRAAKDVSDEQLARSEAIVLRGINACMKRLPGAPVLTHVSDFLRDAPACLATFPEIDHYGAREGADYAGPLYGPANGPVVQWQSKEGGRVLAYLRNGTPGLRNMLTAFARSSAEVICAIPGISASVAREVSTPNVRVFPHPVALEPLLEHASAVICHGGNGTTSQAILSGVPLMAMPASIEQLMQARRYEELGAGLAIGRTRTVESILESLDHVLSDRSYTERAAVFARKYEGFRPAKVAGQAAALVEREIQGGRSLPH